MPNKDFQNGFTLGLSAKGKIGTPTQTKSVTITENGSNTVSPDTGYALSSVGVTVNVPSPYPINVTFMNGQTEHTKVGIKANGKIAEPVTPTGTGVFTGWKDGDTTVTFPYAPISDKTLTANFQQVRTEMEVNVNAGTTLFHDSGNWNSYSKYNSNKSIFVMLGYRSSSSYCKGGILISDNQDDCTLILNGSSSIGGNVANSSLVYNNRTYYYYYAIRDINISSRYFETSDFLSGTFQSSLSPSNTTELESTVRSLLDHYFYADET